MRRRGAPRALVLVGLLCACQTGDTADTEDTAVGGWSIVAYTTPPSVQGLGPFVDPVTRPDLRHGFGPRQLDTEDFHTGLDYAGDRGDAILAIADGTVFRVWRDDGAAQSNEVIVRHALDTAVPFHGERVDHVYSTYSHLDDIDVAEGAAVASGERIGGMGDSGGADTVHLHLEVRLGTWCTLAYQVESASSTCFTGYDPAINPLDGVPGATAGALRVRVVSEDPLIVSVTAPVAVLQRVATDLGVLDWDLREGIDATSPAALDDLDYGWVTVDPAPLTSGPTTLTLRFATAPAWIEITDLFGEGWRLTP